MGDGTKRVIENEIPIALKLRLLEEANSKEKVKRIITNLWEVCTKSMARTTGMIIFLVQNSRLGIYSTKDAFSSYELIEETEIVVVTPFTLGYGVIE